MRIQTRAKLVTLVGRFALPFVLILAVSSTLAYALDEALLAGPAGMGQTTPVCGGGMMYIGLNSWIPLGPATHCVR